MATYIALVNWTDQGVRNVKDSPARVDAIRKLAKKLGCEFKDLYLTIGAYDIVATFEAPDDESMARLALTIASAGNVRTTTLKALPEATFRKIAAAL